MHANSGTSDTVALLRRPSRPFFPMGFKPCHRDRLPLNSSLQEPSLFIQSLPHPPKRLIRVASNASTQKRNTSKSLFQDMLNETWVIPLECWLGTQVRNCSRQETSNHNNKWRMNSNLASQRELNELMAIFLLSLPRIQQSSMSVSDVKRSLTGKDDGSPLLYILHSSISQTGTAQSQHMVRSRFLHFHKIRAIQAQLLFLCYLHNIHTYIHMYNNTQKCS